jgi:hypothetical protein
MTSSVHQICLIILGSYADVLYFLIVCRVFSEFLPRPSTSLFLFWVLSLPLSESLGVCHSGTYVLDCSTALHSFLLVLEVLASPSSFRKNISSSVGISSSWEEYIILHYAPQISSLSSLLSLHLCSPFSDLGLAFFSLLWR